MNLCFKNLGIINLCISARESWKTRFWEKLNKIHVWINCVRSRECRIWRFRGSNFQIFSGDTCPRTHYLIRAFGANSPLVSPIILCLMFSYKKLHAKTIRMMIPSLNEAEVWTPKNTKRDYRNVAPEEIIKSRGDDQKSSWIMNHWGKSDRNHEYQDSNDSASTPEINWSFSMRLCRNKLNILHLFSYSVMSSLFSIINWTKKFWQTFF